MYCFHPCDANQSPNRTHIVDADSTAAVHCDIQGLLVLTCVFHEVWLI